MVFSGQARAGGGRFRWCAERGGEVGKRQATGNAARNAGPECSVARASCTMQRSPVASICSGDCTGGAAFSRWAGCANWLHTTGHGFDGCGAAWRGTQYSSSASATAARGGTRGAPAAKTHSHWHGNACRARAGMAHKPIPNKRRNNHRRLRRSIRVPTCRSRGEILCQRKKKARRPSRRAEQEVSINSSSGYRCELGKIFAFLFRFAA